MVPSPFSGKSLVLDRNKRGSEGWLILRHISALLSSPAGSHHLSTRTLVAPVPFSSAVSSRQVLSLVKDS